MDETTRTTLRAMIAEVVGLAAEVGRAKAEGDSDADARDAELDLRLAAIGALLESL